MHHRRNQWWFWYVLQIFSPNARDAAAEGVEKQSFYPLQATDHATPPPKFTADHVTPDTVPLFYFKPHKTSGKQLDSHRITELCQAA